jgi:ribonuclease HII
MSSPVTIGVDEAGRGAVIGPMTIAGIRCADAEVPETVDDSKRVPPVQRRQIGAELAMATGVEVAYCHIAPRAIDDERTDLTMLTTKGVVDVVQRLARPGDAVLLDAADVDAARFGRRVAQQLGVPDVSITAEHRADAVYPHVGAASIAAKVLRDAAIAAIDRRWTASGGVGSGYPSDPTTRAFIRGRLATGSGLPTVIRTSWSTVTQLRAERDQQTLR